NDTLEQIFRLLKLSTNDLPAILAASGAREGLSHLKPGDKLMFTQENGVVLGIERRVNETEAFTVARGSQGFVAKVKTTPIEIRTAQVRGTISSSLFVAGRAAGLTPDVVLTLANDVFGWDIDF